MKIGVLGTGMVGETIATRLAGLNHEVRMGSRSASNQKAEAWAQKHGAGASHGTFPDAAQFGDTLVNCTQGSVALEALAAAGADNLAGKVLIDVANPLDTRADRRGALLYCDSDSLGERIQAAFPATRVVKTLNTMSCGLMVNPRLLPEQHAVYICGNGRRRQDAGDRHPPIVGLDRR